jgi:hypothetical protein
LKGAVVLAVALGAGWFALRNPAENPPQANPETTVSDRSAFNRDASGTQRRVQGRVERLLADDNDGSRHQRFIIRVDGGTTLLIAHNIDLAPRLDGLGTGDAVEVYGEYEWNDRGGLLHWTHKDPAGRHVAGYIEWRGRRFQ